MKNAFLCVIFFVGLISCSQPRYTIDELTGNYQELQTQEFKGNVKCTLIVKDSVLIIKGCYLIGNLVGTKLSINNDNLWYENNGYRAFFEIYKKGGVIHLYKPFEDNESITFKKID